MSRWKILKNICSMKLLLDTHTFIWFCEDDANLPGRVKLMIEDAENEIYLSTASLWEITIKQQLKKLELNRTLDEILKYLPKHGIQYLDIKPAHLLRLSPLNFIHKDPFDRMLIAQALAEEMVLLTKDENIWQYPLVKLQW
jgi:PIN domain nuclease of toxin-antitoxin system